MDLKGKKVIIIGERDGIQGPAIAECVKSAGAEPVLVQTQCFVWTAAGALDQDGQQGIKNMYDQHGSDNLVVMLGSPNPDSSELYAETVVNGDPTWAGPLAGVAMKLPVFHILEPEIRNQIPTELYEKHLAIMEVALDVEKVAEALNRVRGAVT